MKRKNEHKLDKAARLAQWLIAEQGVDTISAYHIAKNKYGFDGINLIRKRRQVYKPKQQELFEEVW